jgi:hypothetical protein
MFLQAATMSFLSRITGRQWMAVAMAVMLRMILTSHQLDELHILAGSQLLMFIAGLVTMASCILFARFGLPAAMVFSAGTCLHVMLR